MKYIYYILIVIALVSAIFFYNTAPKSPPAEKAAVIINDRIISEKELNDFYIHGRSISEKELSDIYASNPQRPDDRNTLINMLITKELLIQEAQKEGINKEESFRKSIQNFYEQSLIKILMDRKCACLQPNISDDEVRKYDAIADKKLLITIFNADSPADAKKGIFTGQDKRTVSFCDLSTNLQYALIYLKEGENSEPQKMDNGYIVIRLDKIEGAIAAPSKSTAGDIKKMLAEWKREKLTNDWLDDLREKATVKILVQGKGGR